MGLHGISRSEFIFVNGIPHLLEINTVPGMTQASIIPQQCAAANLSLQALFVDMVTDALQRNP
jgi:D-alanine-D-alanine ligase